MKTSLDHLPEEKQYELKRAAELIVEAVNPGLLILFGSYARGNRVEELADDGVHYKYQSDFDLIAVVKNEAAATQVERKDTLHNRLFREIKTPISLIAEDIHFINRWLANGQYFYTDIVKEGIVLHDKCDFELAQARELTPQQRKSLAKEDYDFWISSAKDFFKMYRFAISEKNYNIAAFNLHQVTERFYSAVLLVFTRYKPSTHDLTKLSQRVASIEPRFLTAFPQGSEEEKSLFELLRKSYVSARYKKSFVITESELMYLAERVEYLQDLTETLCMEKIESFI